MEKANAPARNIVSPDALGRPMPWLHQLDTPESDPGLFQGELPVHRLATRSKGGASSEAARRITVQKQPAPASTPATPPAR